MTTISSTQTVQVLEGKHLLTDQEAADFLGISPRTLRRITEAKDIEDVRIGRCRRWRVSDLVAFTSRKR